MHPSPPRFGRAAMVIIVILSLAAAGLGVYYFFFRLKSDALDLPARENLPTLPDAKAAPGDWPWWRGPTSDGVASENEAPLRWSETENVVWKQEIPGKGYSTPILVGDRIILTTADKDKQEQLVLALERSSGKEVWRTTVHQGKFPTIHPDNSHASATPAFDGERIIVSFLNDNALRVSALDLKGNILWQREAGPYAGSGHGSGPSPVLCGSLVIVNDDSPPQGYITAVHRGTGEIAWRKTRPNSMGSYGTPAIAEWGGRKLILLAGNKKLIAYDPKDGSEVWACSGIGEVCANTVTIGSGLAFANTGVQERILMAVRPDGTKAWEYSKASTVPYPPSILHHDGFLFVVCDNGRATCLEASTGKERWSEKLGDKGSQIWASPIRVGNRIYVPNHSGETFVFSANPDEYELLATNRISGSVNASLVASQGKIYLRTNSHLYCFGASGQR